VKWYPRWLLNRNVGKTLLWAVLLLVVAAIANVLGIYLLGSIDDWQQWLIDQFQRGLRCSLVGGVPSVVGTRQRPVPRNGCGITITNARIWHWAASPENSG